MQKQTFTNGEFVLHKVYIPGSVCKFSVWFNRSGELIGGERVDRSGRSYHITDKQRRELSRFGPVWKGKHK